MKKKFGDKKKWVWGIIIAIIILLALSYYSSCKSISASAPPEISSACALACDSQVGEGSLASISYNGCVLVSNDWSCSCIVKDTKVKLKAW